MATIVKSFMLNGIEGLKVEIEASIINGQDSMTIIGLGDQAVKEAADRIQAAIEHMGFELPKGKIVIGLAPGDKRKRGTHYDLGMTIALLVQTGQIKSAKVSEYAYIGELSLNGDLRPCNGVLPMVAEAKRCGIRKIIVPRGNVCEARLVTGIDVYGMKSLEEVIGLITGKLDDGLVLEDREEEGEPEFGLLDFSDVKGQNELIDAIVLGAAGGHNILMIGEPGCGKTMIAQRIPTILPEMTEEEALEVTKIHSISGLLRPNQSLIRTRPFRAPHHNVSLNALIGGGSYAQPGEVSLANHGVLFLDELAEFNKSTLDALRQPLENKMVSISRVNGTNTYPANFMFVSAMNPCPCGYYPSKRCRCSDYEIMHYRNKISGPILERIDIQKNVKPVDFFALADSADAPSSESLRKKVEAARRIQQERFAGIPGVNSNAQMTSAMVNDFCKIDSESTALLKEAYDKFGYSARVIHKLLRMARTAADIKGEEKISPDDIKLVLGCRDLDYSSKEMYIV